jgi:hypothetical protein
VNNCSQYASKYVNSSPLPPKTTNTSAAKVAMGTLPEIRAGKLVQEIKDSKNAGRVLESLKEVVLVAENYNEKAFAEAAISAIVHCMNTYSQRPNIQLYGCHALLCFSTTESRRNSVTRQGGIQVVLAAMRGLNGYDQKARSVQEIGCRVLWTLALNADTTKTSIGKQGGIRVILAAMQRHNRVNQSDAAVQASCLGALWSLSLLESNAMWIALRGGIDLIISAMLRHNSGTDIDGELQRVGCLLLTSLSREGLTKSAGIRTMLMRQGGISVLLRAMRRHNSGSHLSAMLQQAGCTAIANLAKDSKSRQLCLAEDGGIQVVLEALQKHSGAECLLVQREGCKALAHIAQNIYNSISIGKQGGVMAVLAVMRKFGSASDSDVSLQESACLALSNLAQTYENRASIMESDGLDLVLAAMEAGRNRSILGLDADLQLAACGVLSRLAKDSENANVIAERGGIEVVLLVLSKYKASNFVIRDCGRAVLKELAKKCDDEIVIRSCRA